MFKRLFIMLTLTIGCSCAVAYEPVYDKSVDIAVGWTKPPYVIADGNTGFELDLIATVMGSIGYGITPIYVPYGRSQAMLRRGHVDITLTLNERVWADASQLSDVYVVYQNVAVSLKKNNFKIEKLQDLAFHSIVAFQRASQILGDEFRQIVENNSAYMELPQQRRQVEMLLLGNTEVIILDINIFQHLSRELFAANVSDDVDIHRLFPQNHYRAGFRDRELLKTFNLALRQFISSEKYAWLKDKYNLYQPLSQSEQ